VLKNITTTRLPGSKNKPVIRNLGAEFEPDTVNAAQKLSSPDVIVFSVFFLFKSN
jgi:hypothetical protein